MKIYVISAMGILLIGCASFSDFIVPELQNRTLRISRKIAGFEYQYPVCKKKFLGACTKTEMHTDYYDLSDEKTREQLINMGFVGKVREKITQ